jgi:sigma-E factor negative regulatory protein RseA
LKELELTMSKSSDYEAERLSALVDGELDPDDVARVCADCRADTASQAAWYTYHLIGDVLRSDDLASAPARDRVALARLRTRLAAEPVVLAPALRVPGVAQQRASRTPWPWVGLSAVAAGFAAVAAVLVVLRAPAPEPQSLAGAAPRPQAEVVIAVPPGAPRQHEPLPQALIADGKLLRDARLDRYLDAHKHFSGVSALGVPSTFLRGATSDAASR